MQTKKVSIAKILAIALCAAVCAVAFAVPFAMQQKSVDNVSAASSCSLTIDFNNFPTNVKGYAVLSFTYVDSTDNNAVKTISKLFTASNTSDRTMDIGSGVGKLEINCPLYSTISVSGQTDLKENIGATASSYATFDFTSAPSSLKVTVTFNDKGWFAGTTIC